MQQCQEVDLLYRKELKEGQANGTINGHLLSGGTSEDVDEKVSLLESYVEDLKEQNCILIEAVEELEIETQNRVKMMEELLERTAQTTKAYMMKLSDYEQLVRNAFKERAKARTVVKKLKIKCCALQEEKLNHQEHANNLSHDISSLVKLISHARNTGQWDVGNIDFCEVTFEQVFGSVDRLSHWSTDEPLNTDQSIIECLPDNYSHEDNPLKQVNMESPPSVYSHSSVQTLGTSSGGRVTKQDAQIFQLQSELHRSQQLMSSTQLQLSQRDRTIAQLQVQITDLNNEISVKENGCFVHLQMLRKLQENARVASVKTSFADGNFHSETARVLAACQTENGLATPVDVESPIPLKVRSKSASDFPVEDQQTLVLQLQTDNEVVSKECERLQTELSECCDELENALSNNLKLEQEVSVVENLWQELEICKEDNENLMQKMERKRQKVRDLETKLARPQLPAAVETVNGSTQYERAVPDVFDRHVESELSTEDANRLKELERRHRLKAAGLEVVVQQLQGQISDRHNDENELKSKIKVLRQSDDDKQQKIHILKTRIENLENSSLQRETDATNSNELSRLQDQIAGLGNELQVTLDLLATKNTEIENQKQTINNLQDALVSVKRSPKVNFPVANGIKAELPLVNHSTSSKILQNKLSKSREVFDV